MTTKLTLSIDEKVITSANECALGKGKSLPSLVENYLKSLGSKETDLNTFSPKVTQLFGIINLPEDLDYKADLVNSLSKKYKIRN